MKKIIITCIALISFAISHAQGTSTFTDKDNTFSIEYPSDWESGTDKYDGATMVDFGAPKKNAHGRPEAQVSFRMGPLEKGQTYDAVIKEQLKGLKKMFHVSQFIENKKVNGKHILVFNAKMDGTTLKMKMAFWEQKKGMMSVYTFITTPKNYTIYLKDADAILNSFKYL